MKTIKELCDEHGIGQSQLSRMYGIPLRTVQDWFGGRSTPPSYVVTLLEESLKRRKECDSSSN